MAGRSYPREGRSPAAVDPSAGSVTAAGHSDRRGPPRRAPSNQRARSRSKGRPRPSPCLRTRSARPDQHARRSPDRRQGSAEGRGGHDPTLMQSTDGLVSDSLSRSGLIGAQTLIRRSSNLFLEAAAECERRMPPATERILHCNMSGPILAGMLALQAFRALLVLLGLLVFTPVQAGSVAIGNEAVLKTCSSCAAAIRTSGRDVSASSRPCQTATQSCSDDGFLSGWFAMPSLTGVAAAPARFAPPVQRESGAMLRLDRPPKSA